MKTLRNQINRLRNEYDGTLLDEKTVSRNPIHQFEEWMREALEKPVKEPNAMVLATCGADGIPSARIMLLRDFSPKGFVFYTNYNSRKGMQISENAMASLLFFWPELQRQVRIEGKLEKINPEISEAYFHSRPSGNQISAWVSQQSAEVPDRFMLEESFRSYEKKFSGAKIPYPEFWGGYCLKPLRFEFWQGQLNRLHDRIQYKQTEEEGWKISRLAP